MQATRFSLAAFAGLLLLSLTGCSSSVDALDFKMSIISMVPKLDFVESEEYGKVEDAEDEGQDADSESSEKPHSSENVSASAPTVAGSSSASTASTSTAGSNAPSTQATPSAPAAPVHQHSWTYHDAVTEQVWVSNYVYIPRYTCGHCGLNTYTPEAADAHQEAEGLATGTCYAYFTSGYHEDQGWYETRTVTNAYYSCSCGATK